MLQYLLFLFPIISMIFPSYSLLISIFALFNFLLIFFLFDPTLNFFQFIIIYNNQLIGGIDGINLLFLLLIHIIIPILILISTNPLLNRSIKLIKLLSIKVFYFLNLLFFFISFEFILFPLFFLMGFFGSRNQKTQAQIYFLFYTIFGSIFFFISILFKYYLLGTFDYSILIQNLLSSDYQYILFLAFSFAFLIKTPLFGLHHWLPLAHVESSGQLSVILAAILLKFATYGFLRYTLVLFPIAHLYYLPFIFTLLIISIIYSCLSALNLSDKKMIIAYSSIAHMNFSLIGLFSNDVYGTIGAILSGLSHGIISSGLFLIINAIYLRHHSRNILYYRGLILCYPIIIIFLFLFVLSNLSFPLSLSFISEFFIFISSFSYSPILTIFLLPSLLILPYFILWFYQRISKGKLTLSIIQISNDCNIKEFNMLLPLIILSIIFGINPGILTDNILLSSLNNN